MSDEATPPVEPAPAGSHHDKLPPYGDVSQGIYGLQLVIAYLRNGLVDGTPVHISDAVHGAHAAVGVGFSYIPYEDLLAGKGSFALDLSGASDAEIASRLEGALAVDSEGKFGAVVPWQILLPLLLKLIEKWLNQ